MNLMLEQNWRAVFALAAAAKAIERQDERMRIFYEDIDSEKDKKHRKAEHEAEERKKLEESVATTAQIAEFNTHLDAYDGKIVEALMENRDALDKVRDALLRMTEDAYVLPDGRHVFKTADGRQVFDERGAEVPLKIVDPETISDNHPHWENFKAVKDSEGKLVAEQNTLIHFQAKVDDARERAGKSDMSKKELDDLDTNLKASMPTSVRQKLGFAPTEVSGDMRMRAEGEAFADRRPIGDEPSRRSPFAPVPH